MSKLDERDPILPAGEAALFAVGLVPLDDDDDGVVPEVYRELAALQHRARRAERLQGWRGGDQPMPGHGPQRSAPITRFMHSRHALPVDVAAKSGEAMVIGLKRLFVHARRPPVKRLHLAVCEADQWTPSNSAQIHRVWLESILEPA